MRSPSDDVPSILLESFVGVAVEAARIGVAVAPIPSGTFIFVVHATHSKVRAASPQHLLATTADLAFALFETFVAAVTSVCPPWSSLVVAVAAVGSYTYITLYYL